MNPDRTINGAEFEALRQLLFFPRDEFAEFAGITPLQLRQYESGNTPVPRAVSDMLIGLLTWRDEQVDSISRQVDNARKLGVTVHLAWYLSSPAWL